MQPYLGSSGKKGLVLMRKAKAPVLSSPSMVSEMVSEMASEME